MRYFQINYTNADGVGTLTGPIVAANGADALTHTTDFVRSHWLATYEVPNPNVASDYRRPYNSGLYRY
jgi:hypothetical protein